MDKHERPSFVDIMEEIKSFSTQWKPYVIQPSFFIFFSSGV